MWTTSCISSCCKSQDLKQRASRTPSKWWRLLKSSLSSLKPFSSHIHILSTYIINIITPSLRNTSHIFKKNIIEGSLEVKLPTIWTDEKQSREEAERRERVRRKKMQVREKVGKSRNTVFFRGFVAPEGWKVGSLKRRVRRHLGRWEMKSCTPLWREAHLEVKCVKNCGVRTTFEKCTPLWREAHFEVKMHKTHHYRTTFGSWDVEKVHAVVARSTFRSQNVQSTWGSDHFSRFGSRKSARRCGAKHISKSKCTKHLGFGPLLEVFGCGKSAPRCGAKHISKSKCTKH